MGLYHSAVQYMFYYSIKLHVQIFKNREVRAE